jgi:nucleoside-diphosphate-sugar epimerase
MRIVVTGGAGMIGSHLVDALLARGHTVIVFDNFLTGRKENLSHLASDPRLTVIDADITTASDVLRSVGRVHRIYHLASPASPIDFARYPLETLTANAEGTRVALNHARRSGARFLLASTSEVYGEPLEHPQRETYRGNVNPIGPRACYDEGKRYAETLTSTFWRSYDVDARTVWLFNTYGPRSRIDDGRIVPTFCVQALTGQPLTVFGSGQQTRSLCYVEDIVRGLVLAMETPDLGGEVINLGGAKEQTVLQIAETILTLAKRPLEIDQRPLPTDDPTRRCPDIRKAELLLAWRPRISLEEGLSMTLEACCTELEGTEFTVSRINRHTPVSVAG